MVVVCVVLSFVVVFVVVVHVLHHCYCCTVSGIFLLRCCLGVIIGVVLVERVDIS